MVNQKMNNDIQIAKRICDELNSGNTSAILEIYYKYNQIFLKRIKQRLYNTSNAEKALPIVKTKITKN
jgi:hypothetical protein